MKTLPLRKLLSQDQNYLQPSFTDMPPRDQGVWSTLFKVCPLLIENGKNGQGLCKRKLLAEALMIHLTIPAWNRIYSFFFFSSPSAWTPVFSVFSLATSCLSSWILLLSTILNDNGYPLLNTHPVLSATHTTSYSILSKALVRWVLWLSPSPLNR